MKKNIIILASIALLAIGIGMTATYCSDKAKQDYKDHINDDADRIKQETRDDVNRMADSLMNPAKYSHTTK